MAHDWIRTANICIGAITTSLKNCRPEDKPFYEEKLAFWLEVRRVETKALNMDDMF